MSLAPPIVAVVGNSNSGKTRVVTGLVEILCQRGLRIATVKHCPHGHQHDGTGSDSDRHFNAGAVLSLASSPGLITAVERVEGDKDLLTLVSSFGEGIDLVLAEGFKASPVPKVLVVDSNSVQPAVENVMAVVGDAPRPGGAPVFRFDEIGRLADFILSAVLVPDPPLLSVELAIDGQDVPLRHFPASVLAGIASGFVSSLKHVPVDHRTIQIALRRRISGTRNGHRRSPTRKQQGVVMD
jgi:molybdopterin-guanine dinucleotide biosynthesis protein B